MVILLEFINHLRVVSCCCVLDFCVFNLSIEREINALFELQNLTRNTKYKLNVQNSRLKFLSHHLKCIKRLKD